jgi:hypothetical protein
MNIIPVTTTSIDTDLSTERAWNTTHDDIRL